MRPIEGCTPTTPLKAAGSRVDPAPSDPIAIEIDGTVLFLFESADDLVRVDVEFVRNRALEIQRERVADQTSLSCIDYRAEELRERQVPHGGSLNRFVRYLDSGQSISERQRIRRVASRSSALNECRRRPK